MHYNFLHPFFSVGIQVFPKPIQAFKAQRSSTSHICQSLKVEFIKLLRLECFASQDPSVDPYAAATNAAAAVSAATTASSQGDWGNHGKFAEIVIVL